MDPPRDQIHCKDVERLRAFYANSSAAHEQFISVVKERRYWGGAGSRQGLCVS